MRALARELESFITSTIQQRTAADSAQRVQLELVGPPDEALDLLYAASTAEGDAFSVPGGPDTVYTLLIEGPGAQPTVPADWWSQRCDWDYAVSIRNSADASVTLVKRAAWDRRHESLANTSESFGSPGFSSGAKATLRIAPWPFLIARAQEHAGVTDPAAVEWALRAVIGESVEAGVPLSDEPWQVVDALLSLSAPEGFEAVVGVPSVDAAHTAGTRGLDGAYKVLESLARFCADNGFTAAGEQLTEAAAALLDEGQLQDDPRPDLGALFTHLVSRCESAAAFRQAPMRGFRADPGVSWHDTLPAEVLSQLLERVGASNPPPLGSLEIRCTNAVNAVDRAKDEPVVVQGPVELRALVDQPPLPQVVFGRRVARGYTELPPSTDGMTRDDAPPDHRKPLSYRVTADLHRSASTGVVSLPTFIAKGFARIRGALSNPAPGGRERLQQVIRVAGTGEHDLVIFGVSQVTRGVLSLPGGQRTQLDWDSRTSSATHALLVEQNDDFVVELADETGETLGEWTISVQVDDPVGSPPRSRFEALVKAHRASATGARPARPRPVVVPASGVRDLERTILEEPNSWRGVVGCWTGHGRPSAAVDWTTATAGDVQVPGDPRPALAAATPPSSYLEAREPVREFLRAQSGLGRMIPSVDYSTETVTEIARAYLAEFDAWYRASPEAAAWTDCLAVYGVEANTHAGTVVAAPEPIAFLLSPLHPVRFAWHAHAQRLMVEALEDPCPGAAMLDPHAGPGLLAVPLNQGGGPEWRAFVTGDCEDPYWSLAWNANYMADAGRVEGASQALALLGFTAATLTPGFTAAQAGRSLDEVARVFPTRARLRVGIAGQGSGGSGPVEGTMDWARAHFDRPAGEPPSELPVALEIRDLRDDPAGPGASELAQLYQETGEAISWYTAALPPGHGIMDLVILDQLTGQDPRLLPSDVEAHPPAALAPGAVLRLAPRRDFDDARTLQESRESTGNVEGDGLDAGLAGVVIAMDGVAAELTGFGVLRFRPNQQAIAHRLAESSFVAVSSTQVDPACFVRGVQGAGGYLWDYELPGGPSGGGRAGYYLVAVPPPSMRRAVANAARALTGADVPADPLLSEVSRRGIPVLRRVTRGGNLARGELGVLTVARWLQDSFRERGGPVRLPVLTGECVHLLLPVDSYWGMLLGFGKALWSAQQADTGTAEADGDAARGFGAFDDPEGDAEASPVVGRLNAQHPDILVFSVHVPQPGAGAVTVRVTPLEVKLRDHVITTGELTAALKQASNLGTVLLRLWEAGRQRNALWTVCGNAFLAQALDQLFRVYSDSSVHGAEPATWAQVHGRVLQDVLAGRARVEVNSEGVVVAVDTSDESYTSRIGGGSGADNVAVIGRHDTLCLLSGDGDVDFRLADPASMLGLTLGPCLGDRAVAPGGAPSEPTAAPRPTAGTTIGAEGRPTQQQRPGAAAFGEPDGGPAVTGEEQGGGGGHTSSAPLASTGVEQDELGQDSAGRSEENTTPPPALGQANVVPTEVREQARAAFEGFVGNENAIYRITNDLIAAALADPPHLSKNYLLTGEPSTGKTEIARRIAAALALPFVKLEGRGLTARRLFDLSAAELRDRGVQPRQVERMSGRPVLRYPPMVIFVDEIHLVPRGIQESFLTVLEPNDRTMDAGPHVARMDLVTFIFATTRASDLDNAFRTRCSIVTLRSYSLEEVAEIVRRRTADVEWPEDVYRKIAELGRVVPRIALELASDLKTEILVSEYQERTALEHLDQVRRARELDERGLAVLDRQYLEILERWGPLGEQNVATRLGTVDRDLVLEEVEPLLLRLGLITKGLRGREITPEGRRYLRGTARPG
jgi:DNA phosphorothioation-dependent restriction protein DptH